MSERLNEWAVFSEKNKDLCEWLTQMESKVSQNGDILIEEMIEKLKKVQGSCFTIADDSVNILSLSELQHAISQEAFSKILAMILYAIL